MTGEGGALETVVVRDNRGMKPIGGVPEHCSSSSGPSPISIGWPVQSALSEQGFVRTGVDLELALGGPDARYPSRGLLETADRVSLPPETSAEDPPNGLPPPWEGSMAIRLIHQYLARALVG